jgi:SAM-dependent methyltransferase
MRSAEALAALVPFETHRDRDFFLRVYATPLEVYGGRLRAIGFEGRRAVLDAGCGFGQWALAMTEMNARVHACDISGLRTAGLRTIARTIGVANLHVVRSTIDVLPYADASFDAVFCYGAVFFTDYRRSFAEFARVLQPGGLMYFSANDFGWYLYNLVAAHKPSADFSPRRMALRTFRNTAAFSLGRYRAGLELVLPPRAARAALVRSGFEVLAIGPDAGIAMAGQPPGRQFFAARRYGIRSVYEVLCRKLLPG